MLTIKKLMVYIFGSPCWSLERRNEEWMEDNSCCSQPLSCSGDLRTYKLSSFLVSPHMRQTRLQDTWSSCPSLDSGLLVPEIISKKNSETSCTLCKPKTLKKLYKETASQTLKSKVINTWTDLHSTNVVTVFRSNWNLQVFSLRKKNRTCHRSESQLSQSDAWCQIQT